MLYPRVTESRTVIALDGVWDFSLAPTGQTHEPLEATPIVNPIPMAVPASYNDLGVPGTLRDHVGAVWYETTFTVPHLLVSERLVLRFGAVTHRAAVFVNGSLVGRHQGGFTPFEFEVNAFLRPGRNRLTVWVNNVVDESTLPVGSLTNEANSDRGAVVKNLPNFDFFNYAGIHRSVKLYTTPLTYIDDITITTDVRQDTAWVRYCVETSAEAQIGVTLMNEDDEVIASQTGDHGEFCVAKPHLWEPLNAYLYRLKVELTTKDFHDTYEQPFGIRTVEVKDGQFLINHRPFYFKGFGRHEDSPIHGRGFDEALNVRDFALMRWLGANSFRTSHYPYSEELMDLADREGFVVIDEVPAVGLHLNFGQALSGGTSRRNTWQEIQTAAAHQSAIRELIQRDKNHPCVVMWSLANEPASEEAGAQQYFKPLVALAKSLDPGHRPITMAIHMFSQSDTDQVADLLDVLALNRYFGWYVDGGDLAIAADKLRNELIRWGQSWPQKPILMTEYGADTIAGFHEADPVMFTEEYQAEYLRMHHAIFDEFPWLVGEQVWNFADFATSQGVIRVHGNKKGVFTRDRKPKYAAHILRERWTAIPEFDYHKKPNKPSEQI